MLTTSGPLPLILWAGTTSGLAAKSKTSNTPIKEWAGRSEVLVSMQVLRRMILLHAVIAPAVERPLDRQAMDFLLPVLRWVMPIPVTSTGIKLNSRLGIITRYFFKTTSGWLVS